MLAYEGHIDELKAIHGSGEQQKDTTEITSAAAFKAAFSEKGIFKK